jgi:predicted RNase H-like HicB family nuclease
MHRFLVIIEPGTRNYSAYAPDLPGCIATGKTLEDVKSNMREAINMHLQGMMEDNDPIPSSSSLAEYMDIPSPTSAA